MNSLKSPPRNRNPQNTAERGDSAQRSKVFQKWIGPVLKIDLEKDLLSKKPAQKPRADSANPLEKETKIRNEIAVNLKNPTARWKPMGKSTPQKASLIKSKPSGNQQADASIAEKLIRARKASKSRQDSVQGTHLQNNNNIHQSYQSSHMYYWPRQLRNDHVAGSHGNLLLNSSSHLNNSHNNSLLGIPKIGSRASSVDHKRDDDHFSYRDPRENSAKSFHLVTENLPASHRPTPSNPRGNNIYDYIDSLMSSNNELNATLQAVLVGKPSELKDPELVRNLVKLKEAARKNETMVQALKLLVNGQQQTQTPSTQHKSPTGLQDSFLTSIKPFHPNTSPSQLQRPNSVLLSPSRQNNV